MSPPLHLRRETWRALPRRHQCHLLQHLQHRFAARRRGEAGQGAHSAQEDAGRLQFGGQAEAHSAHPRRKRSTPGVPARIVSLQTDAPLASPQESLPRLHGHQQHCQLHTPAPEGFLKQNAILLLHRFRRRAVSHSGRRAHGRLPGRRARRPLLSVEVGTSRFRLSWL
ncbi:uncharacterized protein ACA1_333500, partial [Acanthamoeba castellanii str. Neff]